MIDCDLEFKLKLNTDPDNYPWGDDDESWAIDEIDETKKHYTREELVPFEYNISFKAEEISYKPSYSIKNEDIKFASQALLHTYKDTIQAKLVSTEKFSFSMFGTNREIRDIRLTIYNSGSEKEITICAAVPQFSFEHSDGSPNITPDSFSVEMYIKENSFRELKDLIISKNLTSVLLDLRGVEGFYSYIIHNIHPGYIDCIKVLSRSHNFDKFDDSGVKPLVVRYVKHATLNTTTTHQLVTSGDVK